MTLNIFVMSSAKLHLKISRRRVKKIVFELRAVFFFTFRTQFSFFVGIIFFELCRNSFFSGDSVFLLLLLRFLLQSISMLLICSSDLFISVASSVAGKAERMTENAYLLNKCHFVGLRCHPA